MWGMQKVCSDCPNNGGTQLLIFLQKLRDYIMFIK